MIVKPKLYIALGISGAPEHVEGMRDADLIIAVNKNPNAAMMKMADVAVVADAGQFCSALIRELRKRIRE